MDHMEYSIALPQYVELTNAGAEWTTMKQRLFIHLNPNLPSFHHSNLSTAFLINISLDQVQEVFNMYGLSIEETVRFNKILKTIEDLCLPRFLIIYNRYRFFTCKQNGPEFNGFLQQLLAWSDLCEFGDLKDILLKDCIISGISEESVRQHLLRTEQLDFDKTVEICKAGLVKKHATDNSKSRENRFNDAWTVTENRLKLKDAWTVTENEAMENENTISKLQMVDEATNTSVTMRERGTQTDVMNVTDASCEVMEETDLANQYGLINNPTINDFINDSPLFHSNSDRHTEPGQTQSHSDFLKQNDNIEEVVTEGNVKSDLLSNSGREFDYDMSGLRRSLRNRNIVKKKSEVEDPKFCIAGSTNCSNVNDSIDNQSEFSLSLSDNKCLPDHQKTNCDVNEAIFKCKICNILFPDAMSLKTHEKTTHTHKVISEKNFRCDSCSSSFYTAAHLKVHARRHTGDRPFVCDTCGKGYTEASKLKIHVRNHTGERPYKCPTCNMTFKWSSAFNRHKRTHTGEKPYTCDKCSASFADLTSLQRHVRTHTKDRPYQCMCGSSFTDPSALRVHKRIHTGERPFSCSMCSALFIRAEHLKEHKKLHSGIKPYECEICHSKFSEASKLKSHKRKHTGERPYLCKICGRSFSWTAAYNRHLRTHTLEKPYVCRICGCAFADNSTLVRHRRTHTGERPYHCSHCPSTFADSSSLSRHTRIHTGEKAYTCDICGASFTVKSYLNRHLRIHTGEKSVECDVCNAKFSDSSKLNRHKKIHARTEVKQDKMKTAALLWQKSGDADAAMAPNPQLAANPELAQLHEQDIGQYLSRPFPLDPSHGRTDHDFEDIPFANSMVDAILNIKS